MFGSVPQEILERIAFYAATQSLVGPPSGLLPLLLTCKYTSQTLSLESNPYLYADIFNAEFDTRAVFRRLGSHLNAPHVLACELKKRWIHLKRIRARSDSRILHRAAASPTLIHSLWLAYLMMLENDGKNERQLLDYAGMDVWLMEFWFHDEGASSAASTILDRAWPIEDEKNSIAMWLFWFLLRRDVILQNVTRLGYMLTVMRLTALAANHYPICHPSWTEFLPRSETIMSSSLVTHFSEIHRLHPPTLAPAAILAFLTLALQILRPAQANDTAEYSFRSPASLPSTTKRSEDWDTDWYRCISLGQPDPRRTVSNAYVLGSLEGFWEGVFVYTTFTPYSLLLSGGAPQVLDHCLTGHHRQTWKIREYYLAENQELCQDKSRLWGSGDPLNAHFPPRTRFLECLDSLQIQEPGGDVVHYRRPSHPKSVGRNVMDVIILGEGHSAWGQFNLYGRVRPIDGLLILSKEYVQSERGKWLYRGYLVGSTDGYISGRWRETVSPRDIHGYEGCFAMGRR